MAAWALSAVSVYYGAYFMTYPKERKDENKAFHHEGWTSESKQSAKTNGSRQQNRLTIWTAIAFVLFHVSSDEETRHPIVKLASSFSGFSEETCYALVAQVWAVPMGVSLFLGDRMLPGEKRWPRLATHRPFVHVLYVFLRTQYAPIRHIRALLYTLAAMECWLWILDGTNCVW